jgi:hypothetical protein
MNFSSSTGDEFLVIFNLRGGLFPVGFELRYNLCRRRRCYLAAFVFNSSASIPHISVDTDCDPPSNPAKKACYLREHGLLECGIEGTFGAEDHIEGIVGDSRLAGKGNPGASGR